MSRPSISFDDFNNILDLMWSINKQRQGASDLGIDITNYLEPFDLLEVSLLEASFGEDGRHWILWFCYEQEFGEQLSLDNPAAWDKQKNPICYDRPSLYHEVTEGG